MEEQNKSFCSSTFSFAISSAAGNDKIFFDRVTQGVRLQVILHVGNPRKVVAPIHFQGWEFQFLDDVRAHGSAYGC